MERKNKRKRNPFKESVDERNAIMDEQRAEIRELYLEAYEEAEDTLKSYTRVDKEEPAKKSEIKFILGSMDSIYRPVDKATENIIKNNTDRTINAVLDNNLKYLSSYGYLSGMDKKAFRERASEIVLSGKLYDNRWNLSSAIWGDNKARLQEINKILSNGIRNNDSIYKISKRLERYVNPNVASKIDAGRNIFGIRRKIDYNAQRLARTTVQHAYQEAFVEATINNPLIIGYEWEATSAHPCDICEERDGVIFEKDELPLDHPNGMCVIIPVMGAPDDMIRELVDDWNKGEGDQELNEELDKFEKYLKND